MKRLFLLTLTAAAATLSLTGCAAVEMLNFGPSTAKIQEMINKSSQENRPHYGRYQLVTRPDGTLVKMDTESGAIWEMKPLATTWEQK